MLYDGTAVEQQIRFCTASDGVRIAYAAIGEGPPVVYANGWPAHLEVEWERPVSRAFLEELANGCTLVRYDMRGTGLSDRSVSDFSLPRLASDLEAVVDHLKLEQFALISLGVLAGPIAITHAAQHPQRVSRLVVSSAMIRGSEITSPDRARALAEYVERFGFPLFEFIDQGNVDRAAQHAVREVQDTGAPPATQAALLRTAYAVDVTDRLDRLTMPVLVIHGRGDTAVPFAQGRELAARLPQAKFLPLDGNTGAPWSLRDALLPAIHDFLGLEAAARAGTGAPGGAPLTILFTDIAGSTALTQRLGDEKAQELVRVHNTIVREALATHGGTEIKHTGDGIMASFSSGSRALECAVAIQRAVAAGSVAAPLQIHIGLNAGEPLAEAGDIFGTSVQLARRICEEAEGGEILVANVVRELAAGKGFSFADRGETVLRGFEDPVRLYEVRWRAS
jgi:class 3 adenylate cyclase/alpha-beta hydrolase superfamily lysophospholipase